MSQQDKKVNQAQGYNQRHGQNPSFSVASDANLI